MLTIKQKLVVLATAAGMAHLSLSDSTFSNSNSNVSPPVEPPKTEQVTYADAPPIYVIKDNDTLWGISKKYNFNLTELEQWIKDEYNLTATTLKVGQSINFSEFVARSSNLKITEEYTVKPGDTLMSILREVNKERQTKVTLNDILYFNPEIGDPNLIATGLKIRIPESSAASDLNSEQLNNLDRSAKDLLETLLNQGVVYQKVLNNLFNSSEFAEFTPEQQNKFIELLGISDISPLSIDSLVYRKIDNKPAILAEDWQGKKALDNIYELACMPEIFSGLPARKMELVSALLAAYTPGVLDQDRYGICTAVSCMHELAAEYPGALANIVLQICAHGYAEVGSLKLTLPSDIDHIQAEEISAIVKVVGPALMDLQPGSYQVSSDATVVQDADSKEIIIRGMSFHADLEEFMSVVSGEQYSSRYLGGYSAAEKHQLIEKNPEIFTNFLAAVDWVELSPEEQEKTLLERGVKVESSAHAIYVHKIDYETGRVFFYNSHNFEDLQVGRKFIYSNAFFALTYEGENIWSMATNDFEEHLLSGLLATGDKFAKERPAQHRLSEINMPAANSISESDPFIKTTLVFSVIALLSSAGFAALRNYAERVKPHEARWRPDDE